MKRLSCVLLMLLMTGCGNLEPEPATYRGRLDSFNDLDLRGEIIFTIATDGDVLGSLKGEISPNNKTFEWRGKLRSTSYTGTLKASGISTVDVTGSISRASNRIHLSLKFKQGDLEDDVTFTMDKL